MSDQIPQLPVPSAEEIKKFKAKVPSDGVSGGMGLPIPSPEDIKKFKTQVVEKKKPTESPSVLAKPAVSSVAGLRPMVSLPASKPVEAKPAIELAKPAPAPQQNVSVTGSQGKLLIPEPIQKVPAVRETVTTYKKLPVLKSDKDLDLNPELMLKAIFKNEQGTLGKTTSVKASGGMRNTASGTYQMTDETKRDVFNRNKEFQEQFGNYNSFLKEFNKNPSLEFDAALSHMSDLVKQYGKYALAAWYSPTHAAQAASGNVRALNTVPRRDAGNKMTVKAYYDNAINEYKKLSKGAKGAKDFITVPVKSEVVTQPAVNVPSLEKFNVLSPNWYGGPISKEEKPAVTPKKVGAIEDINNRFLRSAADIAAGMSGLPEKINKAGLMVMTKLLGVDDEYNALPAQAKKEIGNVMSSITQKGVVPSEDISVQAKDYFIKKSGEFLENTNQSDKYLNERFGDFFKDPSVDKATDLFLEIPRGFAGSLPYMINPMIGAISAGSQQYDQDIKEANGKLGWGQLVNAGVTGVSEYYIEKLSQGILNRSVLSATGAPKVAKDLAKGFIKSVLKDVGMEGAGEALTEITQSLSDDITKGREINWVQVANRALDAGIIGFGIAGGMRTTGAGVGYLAKKVMPNSEKNTVDRNTRAMMDLKSKVGPDNSPEVNAVIDNKINELNNANIDIINSNIIKVKSLSDDQLKEIVNIDNGISDVYKQRDAIVSNENLNDEEKQSLLDYLKSQAVTLNEQKDAIQKQTTSQVPIQPEAGAGLQVAEGEPQAEPQVPTQKGQEVVDITANIPKQDLPKVMDLVAKIETGQQASSPEDLQTQQNYAKEVEALLAKRAADVKPVEYSFDVTTPTKFEEGKMPEVAVDNIDWEASGMGNVYDAIDSYGGINDITVVDVRGKNAEGLYEAKVRVKGQDVSREGVVILKDPNAPQKPRVARQRKVSPEFTATEKVLSANGVYPSFENVEAIAEISKSKPGAITQEDIQGVVKVYNKKAKAIADAFNNQTKNENIQAKQPRAQVAAEEATQGAQPESGAIEQPAQVSSKRQEIKSSLEKLKDVGLLRSAITGKKDISAGEIDAQMALTDAMANVWKETTGRDDFYENFFNDVSEGDIDAIMEKGGVLFQNIELPQRPLTRVSLAVFDLPEFKRMEGQEVSINSVRDLARTRGKQIEKDLMQSTLEFDKYKDAKKISFDEFKSDVEMQVMKLEKIRTSSYASYGMDNLGDEGTYGGSGRAWTLIFNSPVDHGEYGHFRGDFTANAISKGTLTGGSYAEWNDWEIRQIPGTEQYAAVDKSMPDNVTQDQLANFIGTAGTKEQVEKWIEDRKNYENDINVGLFGHIRAWLGDKDKTYYLAELQSDYFQKNDPNDLYANQISSADATDYAYKKFDENDKKRLRERLESDLGVGEVLKIKQDKSGFRLFLDVKGNFIEVLNWPYTEGEYNTKEEIATQKENARYRILKKFHEIVNGISPFPEEFSSTWSSIPSSETSGRKEFKWNIFDEYNVNRNNLLHSYRQEYIKDEVEKLKNSEKGVSMLKQFAASQKVHELRLLRESFRNAAQEGAETLRFPTPYTLAVIEGYVNKVGESGTPYEIVSGDPDRLYQGDIIDYGGIEMVVVDANNREITVAPREEVFVTDYYDFIDNETTNYTDEVIGEIKRSVNDVNNITESDIESIEFGDLPVSANKAEDILRNAIDQSEDGSIRLSDVEDKISDKIRDFLLNEPIEYMFWGDEVYSDGDQTYYLVERRGSIENFQQPDEYEEGSAKEDFESQISRDQQTVVNKYKELNKIIKKMRPDAEVVTDDNGMEWIETKLTPEDANNPLIAFQEEGGNIKGAVDFSNDNKASVYMFDGADISTLAHEMSGHLGRRFLEQLANVDEDFAKDYEKAKEWAGVKDNQWSIAAEEKWSRGFERYLRDGKAPTKELKSVFENLRDWLKNIYKYIKGSSIDIELTPEITRVFDNLLGARNEVEFKNLPGYARMMGEVDGIVEKSFNRGVSYMQTMDNAIKYMEKSKVYEDANDTQREAMVREVRKMFKQKEKKAPTAQKILGQEPTKTTITIDESKELAKKLKALEAAEQTGRKIGYKEGLKESEQARKDIIDYVKSLKVNNKISASQFKSIVNALKANLLNPAIRKRVEERIDKIIKKANYADQLDRSNKLRSAIKKASKSKTLASNIARMAKKFAKVNPSAVDNIEEYIDMANIVYASISKPIRTIAEESMVNEYSEMRIKEAQEAKSAGLEEIFNSLVEQGLIPKNLSLAEIQQYILDQEQNKKAEESKQREKENRDVLGKVFDALKDISNVMLNDGYNPFTGEDVTLSEADRQLLKEFTAMDLNKLPIASAYRAQEALMNYIVNGKKFGMLGILNRYQGAENVKIADEKGLKAADFRWAVGGSWWGSRKWAKEVESIPGLFTWLWRGRNRGAEVMKLMGLDEFMAGSAKGKLDRIEAENEYIAKFLDKKPNGKRFNNINNTYERLVYAYLSRSVDGSAEEKQAEFDRRKRILAQNVQAMYQSRNKELIEEGEVLKRELDKAKGAKNADELKGKFDPINEQAVEFISAKFDQYFDLIDDVAEGVYNLILNKDELYTPDMFRSIIDKETNVAEMKSSVDIPFDLLSKKPAGTMLENKRIQNLPGYDVENQDASNVEKILKLDFDSSAFNALEKSLVDAYTAEAVQKYSAFVNSKDFRKLFDNVKDETLFKEIVNYYINNERGKVGYKSDWRAVQNFSSRLKNFATYRALGSATAFLKQSVSAMVNTAINLSNDPYALKQVATAMLKDPAIGDFINRSRSEINLRGAEATADIKSAEKLIRESKYQTLTDVLDVVDKAGRLQMKSLNIGDVPMARASWFGYYVHALKQQGKPYKNIDWATAKLDKDALAYANREVSLNQNASMPSTLGQLFSSKNPGTRLVATYFFPFTSFLFNAKSRLKTDITVLTSKLATAEDKQAAGRSMAATLAEMPMYIAVSTAINYALVSMAQSFLGYDEDEEDEKLRLKRYSELAVTRIITDLLSPLPNVGDVATVAAFNALLEKMQEEPEMTKEEQMDVFKLFESKPESMAGAMSELLAQPIASTVRRVDDIYTTLDMAIGDYYVNDKGTEIEFSAEDKRMLQIAASIQIMGSLNLLPSEAESLAKKMVRTIEKRAKE